MKNFVISLTHATERRAHIQRQFNAQDIPFEFFDAVTPEPARQLAEKLSISVQGADLTQGEIACLISHVCLWQKIVDENITYATIFEDDIFLAKGAAQYLTEDQWIKQADAHIIKIEAFAPRVFMSAKRMSVGQGSSYLSHLTGMHLGCAGYILSKHAAKSLLDFIQAYATVVAVDHIVFEDYVKVGHYPAYQMNPALCMQSDIFLPKTIGFESSLEKERRSRFDAKLRKNKQQLSFALKIKRELLRVVIQLQTALNRFLFYRKVYFDAHLNSEQG